MSIATPPSRGSAIVNPDGSITYTPSPDLNGADSLVYRVVDATNTIRTATLNLAVSSVNDIPIANNDTPTTNQDLPVSIDVLGLN